MNRIQMRLALAMLAGFVLVLTVITIGNAQSMVSDFEAAGVPFTLRHVWIWQVTSVVAWAVMAVPIWWAAAKLWPPRFGWELSRRRSWPGCFSPRPGISR